VEPEEFSKVFLNWTLEERERFLAALPGRIAYQVKKHLWYMLPKEDFDVTRDLGNSKMDHDPEFRLELGLRPRDSSSE
jgi:hypothetical protein